RDPRGGGRLPWRVIDRLRGNLPHEFVRACDPTLIFLQQGGFDLFYQLAEITRRSSPSAKDPREAIGRSAKADGQLVVAFRQHLAPHSAADGRNDCNPGAELLLPVEGQGRSQKSSNGSQDIFHGFPFALS